MSDDALGTVLLLRNAAAHAGQIKRELAAIIQVCQSYLKNALQLDVQRFLPTNICMSIRAVQWKFSTRVGSTDLRSLRPCR